MTEEAINPLRRRVSLEVPRAPVDFRMSFRRREKAIFGGRFRETDGLLFDGDVYSAGMMRRMNPSNSGTVKAVSPCAGL
jgi:hypothetical protein